MFLSREIDSSPVYYYSSSVFQKFPVQKNIVSWGCFSSLRNYFFRVISRHNCLSHLICSKTNKKKQQKMAQKNHYIYLKRNMIVSGMYTILMEGMWHRVQAGYCILKRCNLIIFLFFYKGVFLFCSPICVQIASLIIALSGIHHRNGSKQSLSIKILLSYFWSDLYFKNSKSL